MPVDDGRMSLFHHPSPATNRLGRMLAQLRRTQATQVELQERMLLLNRPWLEDLLHWSYDGEKWRLHGTVLPPADGRRRSVTREGWCPRQRAASAR
jgi:hypothetical protein